MNTAYKKIYKYYKDLIISKEMKNGVKMPTEEEIGNLFNVSRITVRHALDDLANDGYISKIQGKGSYVSSTKASLQLNKLKGFSVEMRLLGKTPTSIVHNVSIIEANEDVATHLNIPIGSKVYDIERIRCADGVKMAFEKMRIPFSFIPGIEKLDLSCSFYDILQEKYGIVPMRAVETFEAGLADKKFSELLEIEINSPILSMERISYSSSGKIYEYTDSTYCGDKYKFTVVMD
ncbi:MAG: GntR family transcriptional regulator [Sphaerochaetaceae bacterium]